MSTLTKIMRLMILGLAGILVGCASGDDLRAYVKKVKERPGQGVEPLPEVKPYKPFLYGVADLRSPFVPPVPTRHAGGTNGPDLNRPKEALEAFPLDSLRMVGTLSQGGVQWALIRDKTNTLHHVKVGNYLGQNYGRVTKITEDKVYITEMLPDSSGSSWQEHPTTIAISDQPNQP